MPAKLGDYVWFDLNGDGIQNEGGFAGINGVVVELRNSSGAVLATTTTNYNPTTGLPGWYQFTNLKPGVYVVKVADSNFASGQPLFGTEATSKDQGGDDALDSDGYVATHASDLVALRSGANNQTVDFGFIRGVDHVCARPTASRWARSSSRRTAVAT